MVPSGVPRIGSRLVSWWWDLPLRWKGFVAIALPSLVLLPALVAVLLLTSSDDDLGGVVIGVLVATALSWGGMWIFTRGIVRRVETVSAVAARVIDGETSIDIEEPANDELGRLIAELRRAAELLILTTSSSS